MPSGGELEIKVSELKEGGLTTDQILDTIFAEDYNTPVSELITLLECKPWDVGRAKGRTKQKIKATQRAEGIESIDTQEGEPTIITKFREALKDNIMRKEARPFTNTLVSKFSKRFNNLMTSQQTLMNWLMVQGCDSAEANRITEDMFLSSEVHPTYGGQQQAYVQQLNPQTGQWQTIPIVMMQPQQPNVFAIDRGQPQQQPQPIFYPPYPQPQLPQSDTEVHRRMDRIERALADLADRISSPPPQQPGHQMRRIPIQDADGNIIYSPNGNVVYQEVPYDPSMSTMELITSAAKIFGVGQPRQEFDEEKLALKTEKMIREATEHLTPKETDTSDKTREMIRDEMGKVNAQVEHVAKRLEGIEKKEEIEDAVAAAVRPLHEQLEKIQTRSGLSDQQFTMTHREHLVELWHNFMSGMVGSVRQDLRPAIIQAAVASMKSAGMSDQTIQSVVQSISTPTPEPIRAGIQSKITAAREKWLR